MSECARCKLFGHCFECVAEDHTAVEHHGQLRCEQYQLGLLDLDV